MGMAEPVNGNDRNIGSSAIAGQDIINSRIIYTLFRHKNRHIRWQILYKF